MRRYIYIFAATLSLLACNKKETNQSSTDAIENEAEQNQKIVSLNGAISEALVILGAESQIIGVDVTSTYPESLKTKATDLGHVRSITAESILSLKPNVVFALLKMWTQH